MKTYDELYERYSRGWHPLVAAIEAQKEINREANRDRSREDDGLGDDNS